MYLFMFLVIAVVGYIVTVIIIITSVTIAFISFIIYISASNTLIYLNCLSDISIKTLLTLMFYFLLLLVS